MKFKITSPIIEPTEGSPHQEQISSFASLSLQSRFYHSSFSTAFSRFNSAYRSYRYSF
ncbi:hypothetical protein [Vibrio fortis]|uniref:hypothetical protein n=1 Tax=Vibrio fortis TaxID=212667 RepID=UPI0021C326F6|nr:hypothetical protein [Vibrio fortis]